MSKIKIELLEEGDLSEAHNITQECAKDLISKKIFQWSEEYPSLEILSKDIEQKQIYGLKEDGTLIGIIVISEIEDDEYKNIEWVNKNGPCVYIHRLAVNPKHQGKSHAKKLMDFAENFARDKGFKSLRLDTFSKNQRNNKLYQNRGYQKLSDIYLPNQSEYPFHCYELVL